MNKNTFNHITVYGLLYAFYLKYKLKIDVYLFLKSNFANIEINRQKLLPLGGKQGTDNTGIAEETSVARKNLISEIYQIAGPSAAKLYSLGKKAIAKTLKFTKSELLDMRPEILLQTANLVFDTCTSNIDDLEDTGITIESLAPITVAKDLYFPEVNASKAAIRSKTVVTVNIAATIRENTDIINNQLKGGMQIFVVKEPDMYAEFEKMLVLPHEGVHSHHVVTPKAIVTLSILNDTTSEPLDSVTGKFVGTRKSFKSDSSGMLAANLQLGANLGKLEKEGFEPNSFAFTLTDEGLILTIRMIPIVIA